MNSVEARTEAGRVRLLGSTLLLASTMLTGVSPAIAQEVASASGIEEIVVTAQKRSENLQSVPMSIQAINTEKLDQLQVSDFKDYAKFLPSVSYQTIGPGFSNVYFRGVASGENANHSASLPSVGTYLDEQPITTITGALDLHVYDIERVEALAGPQGTLYGASSQSGTLRIITNKPDTSGFYGGADVELNSVAHGGWGYVGEGFVNVPVSDSTAIRLVGWYDHDGGYIDNVPGTRTYPTLGETDPVAATSNNAALVEDNFNDVDTYGARAALKIDLNDSWTVTPTIMGQQQKSHGSFAYEPKVGRLKVQQYNPERANDRWYQASLTIQGKLGNFDLVYAGAYLKRKINSESDYSDYAYFYDALYGYGAYFYDENGALVNPNQYIKGVDRFTKQSHELRISSPQEERGRFVVGAFYQRQTHNIEQHYIIDGIGDGSGSSIGVPGQIDNIWLTKQFRVDRDYALFGELAFDFTDKLTGTVGVRAFKSDNSLVGFFGYGANFSSRTGVAACFAGPEVDGSPCTNLDKRTKETDFTEKANLTYKITDDHLIYATYSRGFRPGGINRRGTLPPYSSDFLANYEFGWKTSWLDRRLRFNGAVYLLDWTDIQFSFLGANGLTEIRNAGNARIKGVEADITAVPVDGLTLTAAGSYNEAKLRNDYCQIANPQFDCTLPGPAGETNSLLAPKGQRLPITPKFKGNVTARYEFPVGDMKAHMQGAVIYQTNSWVDLRTVEREILGRQPGYTTADLSFGVTADRWSAELFATNIFDKLASVYRYAQCGETICGDPDNISASGGVIYTVPTHPRVIGLKVGTKF